MGLYHKTTSRKPATHSANLLNQQQAPSVSLRTLRPPIQLLQTPLRRSNRRHQPLQPLQRGAHTHLAVANSTLQSKVTAPRGWMDNSLCSKANQLLTRKVCLVLKSLMEPGGGSGSPTDLLDTQRTPSYLPRSTTTNPRPSGWRLHKQATLRMDSCPSYPHQGNVPCGISKILHQDTRNRLTGRAIYERDGGKKSWNVERRWIIQEILYSEHRLALCMNRNGCCIGLEIKPCSSRRVHEDSYIWSSNLEIEAFVTFDDMFYLSWYAQPVHLFQFGSLLLYHEPYLLLKPQLLIIKIGQVDSSEIIYGFH